MSASRRLRPTAAHRRPTVVYNSVAEACESGDRRAVLAALRRRLALTIDADTTSARDLAPLIRRLLAVETEIDELG